MPNRHKHPPLSFRPREESDRVSLLAYAEETGQPVSRILGQMLHDWLARLNVPDVPEGRAQ